MSIQITSLKLAVAAMVAVTVSTVLAQPGPGRMGRGFPNDPSRLLGQESVQKELDLSDEQHTSVQKLVDDNRQAMTELRNSGASPQEMGEKMQDMAKENKKKVEGILLPNQLERLNEISLQFTLESGFPGSAAMALTQDDLAKKINLSDDQKQKLQDVLGDAQKKMQDMFAGGGPPDQQEMAKIRTEVKDKTMDVLTADQKEKLTTLEGKKFDVSSIQMFGRRGGGGGGPPKGGN